MKTLPIDELIRKPKPLPTWWNKDINWKKSNIHDMELSKKNGSKRNHARGELTVKIISFISKQKENRWIGTGEIRRGLGIPPGSTYLRKSIQSQIKKGIIEQRLVKDAKRGGKTYEYRLLNAKAAETNISNVQNIG